MDANELDYALALLRVVIGLTIAAHGAQKLFGWWNGPGLAGFAGWLGSMGLRPAKAQALVAALGEFVGGLAFALGLLTPIAALVLVAVMLVAIATVHLKSGFFVTNGGYEFNLAIIVVALAVALTGPGQISLDDALDLTDDLSGWTWALIALGGGIIGAAGPLLTRQAPASTPDQ